MHISFSFTLSQLWFTPPYITIQALFIWQDKRPQQNNNKKRN